MLCGPGARGAGEQRHLGEAAVAKPTKIAVGIAVAGTACAVLAALGRGPIRVVWLWTAVACGVGSLAYVRNRPGWLGKRRGRFTTRTLVMLPYVVAFRVACELMRWWRGPDRPTAIAPGLWIGGRATARSVPPGVRVIVDLVAEYPAPRALRLRPGYRGFTVIDGGQPPTPAAFVALVADLVAGGEEILVHCDSGRGRAPTLAVAILIARGLAPDVGAAVAMLRARRPVVALTRSDLAFLDRVVPAVRRLAVGRASIDRSVADR